MKKSFTQRITEHSETNETSLTLAGGWYHNYNPVGLSTSSVLRVKATGTIRFGGIMAPSDDGGLTYKRKLLYIFNVTPSNIALMFYSGHSGSSPENRFILYGVISVFYNRCAILFYDVVSLRWRLLNGN